MGNVDPKKIAIELAVATILNVLAGAMTFLLTRQIAYALVAVIILESLVIGLLSWQLMRKPKLVGIIDSAATFAEGPSVTEIAKTVATEFVFWGISAKSILSNDEFREIMIRKAKGNCEFKFLLLDPKSRFVADKALEEGDTAEGWKNEIEANILRLRQLRDEHHLNIEIKVYDQFPVFRLIIANSNLMYFGWYSGGLQGIRSPLLIVQNNQGSLYQPARLTFNDLWVRATEPSVITNHH